MYSQNRHFHIEKNETSSSVSLHLKTPNVAFLKSIAKLDFMYHAFCDTSFSKIQFLGSNVFSLPQFMEKILLDKGTNKLSYNTISRLIQCIAQQQILLEEHGYSFFSLSLDDIIVIDEWNFFSGNPNLCRPLSSNKMILFTSPFERNNFVSPEIIEINKLPSSVSIKTFYYSLASMAFFCFFRKQYNCSDNDVEIYSCFQSILNTKLYWFFKRAFEKDVNKRSLIYI